MRHYYFLLTAILLTCVVACKKVSKELNQLGVVFYNSTANVLSNGAYTLNVSIARGDSYTYGGQFYRGALLKDDIFSFPVFGENSYSDVESVMQYNFSGKPINTIQESPNDTCRVRDIVYAGSDRYVANAFRRVVQGQNETWYAKMELLDQNFKPLYQKYFKRYYDCVFLEKLNNGNFVMLKAWGFTHYSIYCFNEALDSIWETPSESYSKVYFCVGNNSMVWANENEISQFDYNGKKLKSYNLPSNDLIHSITALPDGGYLVLGTYSRADKYDVMFAAQFDDKMNLINSKLIETPAFSPDPNLKIVIRSNTVIDNGNFYFIVHMRNPEVAFNSDAPEEAKLIRMSSDLNISFVKTIDEQRQRFYRSYIVKKDQSLLMVGPSIWNGQKGFSFIRTDMDGNIWK